MKDNDMSVLATALLGLVFIIGSELTTGILSSVMWWIGIVLIGLVALGFILIFILFLLVLFMVIIFGVVPYNKLKLITDRMKKRK